SGSGRNTSLRAHVPLVVASRQIRPISPRATTTGSARTRPSPNAAAASRTSGVRTGSLGMGVGVDIRVSLARRKGPADSGCGHLEVRHGTTFEAAHACVGRGPGLSSYWQEV